MAGIGPFESFSFPGVYTKTINEAPVVGAAGELRFPAFIGIGDEEKVISDYEMVRGSSSLTDTAIINEDVSSQFIGTNRNFTVTYFPLVTGEGTGTITNNIAHVKVTQNGQPAAVASVSGLTGVVNLVSIPALGDTILASYYFKRSDTLHTEEDLSDQANGVRVIFQAHYLPIVTGNSGGITSTDPADITVKVNNTPVTVSSLDGDVGQFTLAAAPIAGDTVKVTYYSNEWQDTADILPSPNVASITKVGVSPGTSDFINGTDFILDTTGSFGTINWGHSYKIASGIHTIASEYFDDSQITGTLFDNRVFRRKATGTADGTNKVFTLEYTPVEGTGLGVLTDNPDLFTAYIESGAGTGPSNAVVTDVIQASGSAKTVTLATAPDASRNVYVTFYENRLPDDVWTLTNKTAGGSGVGVYNIAGATTGTAYSMTYSASDTSVADADFAVENVTYPAGTGAGSSDAQVTPGYGVSETVKLTFSDSTKYIVSSNNGSGTGTAGDNTGYLNQTYIDRKTGFRVTVLEGTSVTYALNDYIGYRSAVDFTCSAVPTRAIPGIRTAVANTTDVGTNDTATLTTYNKSGNEPAVGDFYYVTFNETKTNFDPAIYTTERSVVNEFGVLSSSNKLSLATHLAFMNGAPAVALKQILRSTGGVDAPDSAYIAAIDEFNEPMTGGYRPSLMEPLTTSSAVIAYAKNSNTIQAGIRYANERMTYFGFPLGTTPTAAQVVARSLNSERMIGIYPDGAVTSYTDELGNDIEFLVGGEMLAAAISGRDVSPAYDVAEPLTRKSIVGFTRLYRRLDSVTQAQTANAGLTILEESGAQLVIKIDLTTDLTSALTRTPSVIRIKDFIQKGTRSVLLPFIGSKNLNQRTGEIETTLNSYLKATKKAEIITAFTGVKATPNATDPSTVDVEAFYSPVFPLLWIVVTYNLRSRL